MHTKKQIHAVIGVRRSGAKTFYVRRSNEMENYPGVWSLFSIQYDPASYSEIRDVETVKPLFAKMSDERLGGVGVRVVSYLTSGSSDQNPMRADVCLHLYEIEFDEEPKLNGHYYTDGTWLSAEEFEARSAKQVCGLCLRLWSDYAWLKGYTDRPFIPHTHPATDTA